jgi:hypothetical protein
MFLGRERLIGLGNDLTSASAASIDARMDRHFFGPVFSVEFRTDADFHIIAAPEQRHESSSPRPITLAQTTPSGFTQPMQA